MKEQKKTIVQACVIGFLMILTLPLFYLLFTKVLLPLAWKESSLQLNNFQYYHAGDASS